MLRSSWESWADLKKKEEINSWYRRIYKFLSHDVWYLDFSELSRIKVRFMRYLQITLLTVKGVSKDKVGMQTTSLSYFSALSMIPFVALLFTVTNGFGLKNWLEEQLYVAFEGNENIIQYVLSFANNIIEASRDGIYGIITFCVFLWTIVLLMLNIEQAFNRIWNVEKSRALLKRVLYYIGILIMSPFVVIIFLWMSIMFTKSLNALEIAPFDSIKDVFLWLIGYAISVAVITAIYKFIPHTKVHLSAAFNSALITAAFFMGVQYLYFETQLMVTRLNMVYGAFAAVPFFLVWINMSWWILLLGAEVSHAYQNIYNYKPKDISKNGENNKTQH